jgi:hypothetical protein
MNTSLGHVGARFPLVWITRICVMTFAYVRLLRLSSADVGGHVLLASDGYIRASSFSESSCYILGTLAALAFVKLCACSETLVCNRTAPTHNFQKMSPATSSCSMQCNSMGVLVTREAPISSA